MVASLLADRRLAGCRRPLGRLLVIGALLFGLGLVRVGNAAVVTQVTQETTGAAVQLDIDLDVPQDPVIRYSTQEACWQIDLIGTSGAPPVAPSLPASFRWPLLGIRVDLVHDDPPIQRVSLYTSNGARLKVARAGTRLRCVLRSPDRTVEAPRLLGPGRRSLPPIQPAGETGEVVLQVSHADPLPIITQLAQAAGVTLRFRDGLPRQVTAQIRAGNALEALRAVAERMGMQLSRESDGWWLTCRDNPLLELPAEPLAQPVRGVATVRDVLQQIGGPRFLDLLGARLSPEVAARPLLEPVPVGVNPRTFAQNLLESHGITLAAN
ncbi:MAG: hypothetical protein OZSIB_1196 [Candidatus Ozemobacter sibiricus]|uniref:Uncharacterized protein n=1 Tax=Candidatus Ozemobacter sibiricus TaxID=2268124 RepID=A0A367ZLP1_9BACT|nr:MAG: hypothetical protein OZSIB_1196 [Candidatus Ozemobacter sibiricus]